MIAMQEFPKQYQKLQNLEIRVKIMTASKEVMHGHQETPRKFQTKPCQGLHKCVLDNGYYSIGITVQGKFL